MKITCITTTFNESNALFTSVNSVLNQTYENFEYLIVDDGSTDDTLDLLDTLTDPRIKVLRQANDGLSSARNRALEHVTGDYVCFLDADDCRPNWAFQSIADTIARDDPDMVLSAGVLSDVRGDLGAFYDTRYFDMIAEISEGECAERGAVHDWVWPLAQLIEPQSANKAIRADLLKRRGIGFPNTHFFEDIFFHSNVLAASDRVSFLRTPTFTYFRRYSRPQITSTAGDKRFDIIAVTKLTLESFARYPQFHDPLHRMCVVASCAKLLEWCENSIGHQHRYSFRHTAAGMLKLVDPLYLHFPDAIPGELLELYGARNYVKGLVDAA